MRGGTPLPSRDTRHPPRHSAAEGGGPGPQAERGKGAGRRGGRGGAAGRHQGPRANGRREPAAEQGRSPQRAEGDRDAKTHRRPAPLPRAPGQPRRGPPERRTGPGGGDRTSYRQPPQAARRRQRGARRQRRPTRADDCRTRDGGLNGRRPRATDEARAQRPFGAEHRAGGGRAGQPKRRVLAATLPPCPPPEVEAGSVRGHQGPQRC